MSLAMRTHVVSAVVASYFLGFIPLVVAGWTGIWWISILLPSSLPLLPIACLLAFFFAKSITKHPVIWSLGAFAAVTTVSELVSYLLSNSMIGLVSILETIPATMIFCFATKRWLKPSPVLTA
jgi:hypothetical protein